MFAGIRGQICQPLSLTTFPCASGTQADLLLGQKPLSLPVRTHEFEHGGEDYSEKEGVI